MTAPNLREYTAADVLRIGHDVITRVSIAQDTFPSGLSVAMAPVLVDWDASSLEGAPDDFFVLKNVNVSTNPVAGIMVLGTVRVPANAVERIEWVLVISKLGGRETQGGHAQLRFVFHEDQKPTIASNEGDPLGTDLSIQDLVLSWEAWRPPLTDFDPVAGLDPEIYALTLRASFGPVRCLADAVMDRPWACYPLRLPDVPGATSDVLHTCLLLGDALARQTNAVMLDEHIEAAKAAPPGYQDDASAWEEIRTQLAEGARESPIEEMLGGRFGYHLLERSCISLALMSLDAANVGIHERAGRKPPERIRAVPEELPELTEQLARRDRLGSLRTIPSAMRWLKRHPEISPARAHDLLDEVGLLERNENGIVSRHFDNRKVTPYGRVADFVIF